MEGMLLKTRFIVAVGALIGLGIAEWTIVGG
jgi:hypothetical protein